MKSIIKAVLSVGCAIGIALSLAPSATAQTPVPPKIYTVTNSPGGVITNGLVTVFPTAAKTVVNSQPFLLFRGRGFSFMPYFAGTNSGTANVISGFDLSPDGTNWTTTAPLTKTSVMNGTIGVRDYVNFISDNVDNMKYGRLAWVSNGHTASIFWTNGTVSITP